MLLTKRIKLRIMRIGKGFGDNLLYAASMRTNPNQAKGAK
jgi:hypothetical protein